jgi:hypothetical protein
MPPNSPKATAGLRFAVDSPLEEAGFEPLVPLTPKNGREAGERHEQIASALRRIDKQSLERLVTAHRVLRGAVFRRLQPGEAE